MTSLVLLPGMDGTGLLFEPLVEVLPHGLKPVVVRFSNDALGGYEELLPTVRAALPRDEPFLLVAESFSGPLAVMMANERPRGLLGVVLSASFVKNPLPWAVLLPRAFVKSERVAALPSAIVHQALLGEYRTPRLENLLDRAKDALTPQALRARLKAASEVDVTRELRDCPVPVLYLRAERDVLVPRHCALTIVEQRPDVRIIELDAPHCLLQTRPRECAAAIAEFARGAKIATGPRPATPS